MLVLVLVALASSMPVTPGVAETARLAWNTWQEFERDNLPWLYRCEGPIGTITIIIIINMLSFRGVCPRFLLATQ